MRVSFQYAKWNQFNKMGILKVTKQEIVNGDNRVHRGKKTNNAKRTI